MSDHLLDADRIRIHATIRRHIAPAAGLTAGLSEYVERVAEPAKPIKELDVAAMVLDMRPPCDDEAPIALDGTPLDTPGKLVAYLEQINAARDASERQRAS